MSRQDRSEGAVRKPPAQAPGGDDDRTVIAEAGTLRMPAPGGRSTAVLKRGAQGAKPVAGVELQRLVAGINPLLAAANVLLALVAQLRATPAHGDPAGLRQQLLERVKDFEAQARANGVPAHQISAARYILCCFLDETIAGTPWGSEGPWGQRNLLQEFHDERSGGDKVFKLLARLREDVRTNRDLLELFHVCLALGFEGRYRGQPNGRHELDAIAERLLEEVHPVRQQASSRSLSPRWKGVSAAAYRRLWTLPAWVVVVVGAALVLGIFLALNSRLAEMAHPVFRQIHDLTATLGSDRKAPAGRPRLAPLLQADVAAGALEVRDEALRSVVSLPADALFEAGSARIERGHDALLAHVASALKDQPGVIVVVGHADDTPIATLQFPSSWHLSRERAQAVVAALSRHGVRADRMRAEGRGDVEPRVPNNTAEARARNRRVEVELLLPRPEA